MHERTDSPAGKEASRWHLPVDGGGAPLYGARALSLMATVIWLLAISSPMAAWGQSPGEAERDAVDDANDRCLAAEPGSFMQILRCPGGQPLSSPWILWPGAGLLMLGTVFSLLRHRRREEEGEEELPFLIFRPPPATSNPADHELPPPTLYPAALDVPALLPESGGRPILGHAPFPHLSSPQATALPDRPGDGAPLADRALDEATVQLLPGRLKILVGAGVEREFRFARGPGRVTEVTIGRKGGTGPDHVQLAAPTVSRLHARLRFEGESWVIENLSRTNPVVVNGEVLGAGLAPRPLREGDRLEIGEFILCYHER
jgi:hypothetical protein